MKKRKKIKSNNLEVFVRKTLKMKLDEKIGFSQIIDFYEDLIFGLELDEELEKTFTLYQWASTMCANYERAHNFAEIDRRHWAGQMAVDLKSTGTRVTDSDVKQAIRAEPEWERFSNEEAEYTRLAQVFRSFSIILLKKADSLTKYGGGGLKLKADYGDFNIKKIRSPSTNR